MSKDARQPDRDELKRRLMKALLHFSTRRRTGDGPRKLRAITIANWLKIHLGAKHETRRRRVRELINECRQEGGAIASDFEGCWLATEPEDHTRYQEFMRRMGLAHLVAAAADKHAPATAEAAGQLPLFKPAPLAGSLAIGA